MTKEFPYFCECLKFNFITFYNDALRKPLIKKKEKDRQKYDRRNDYKQYIMLNDLTNVQINKLRIKTFEVIDITRNLHLEEFMMTRILSMKITLFENWIAALLKK